ncbi:hypothetical protein [Corynebacterium sp. UMB2355A]|uniref:hypothetical protein n=1 Tax=Corynebacterium sp. UMB2355A TaxID=3081222 RepID=UPI0029FF17F7|nr:hypothetical protein [Corynebacterium sp. UMB2355A]WPJ91793.1 hypothetical protein R0V12_05635 [Corynebacterium sp. UMB2355A]WPJ93789.1 hypothetical protein R0V12_05510 [Corynebacterium sp. UMB2355A]
MKKIAAVALAATMTVGALAPTAGAHEYSNIPGAYAVNKFEDNKCWILAQLDGEMYGFGGPRTPAEAADNLRELKEGAEEDKAEGYEYYAGTAHLLRFITGTDDTRTDVDLLVRDVANTKQHLFEREYRRALEACATGREYETNKLLQQSSKMTQSERAAAFWTPVALLFAGVLGAVALPTLKPMLPANIAAMLP